MQRDHHTRKVDLNFDTFQNWNSNKKRKLRNFKELKQDLDPLMVVIPLSRPCLSIFNLFRSFEHHLLLSHLNLAGYWIQKFNFPIPNYLYSKIASTNPPVSHTNHGGWNTLLIFTHSRHQNWKSRFDLQFDLFLQGLQNFVFVLAFCKEAMETMWVSSQN